MPNRCPRRVAPIGLLVFLVAVAGCGRPASSPGGPTPTPAAAATTAPVSATPVGASPAVEWKPGSHAASVYERMLQFRQKRRAKFKAFVIAYAASHGNVKNPRLARLKHAIMSWFVLTEADYKNLPAYMKVFSNTGPYRRLTTKPGFSYVSGTVFLPCKAARLHADFETAFAYVGGWGAGKNGTAVDAGFQRGDRNDDYAAFILAQGFHQVSKYPRFVCGHPVDFRFFAASDRALRLWTRGTTTNNRVETVVATLNHSPTYGWPSDGGGASEGIVLKRMTTIGQSDAEAHLPDGVSWDDDGSYFGHYAGQRQPRVRWSNLKVGRVDSKGNPRDLRPWGIPESNLDLRAGMLNYPSDPHTILYTCTACPDESNAINLAAGASR